VGGAVVGAGGRVAGGGLATGIGNAFENTKTTLINAAAALPSFQAVINHFTGSNAPLDPRQR
jgi:hypothetical protein